MLVIQKCIDEGYGDCTNEFGTLVVQRKIVFFTNMFLILFLVQCTSKATDRRMRMDCTSAYNIPFCYNFVLHHLQGQKNHKLITKWNFWKHKKYLSYISLLCSSMYVKCTMQFCKFLLVEKFHDEQSLTYLWFCRNFCRCCLIADCAALLINYTSKWT